MKRILSALLLAALWAASLSSAALADVAPPHQPPGFNPGPGSEITQVRMMAETVTIDVLAVEPEQAHVSAFFTMRNLGEATEFLAVRFPIAASDGFSHFPEIKNISIKVNDQVTPFGRIQGREPLYGFEDQSVPWAEFNVSFLPGEEVFIKVSYDLAGTGYSYETFTSFYYTLSTGAGWNGTIGSGEIILRLPYNANEQNVILSDSQARPQFSDREARWTFTDLEPTPGNNLTFELVKPVIWQQVSLQQENIARNPKDGEAYGLLGKAYKQAFFASPKGFPRSDQGATVLYQQSKEAYKQAIALKPDDGLWHAGYAELLLDGYYWTHTSNSAYTSELDQGFKELRLAYQLAPKDAKVLELVDKYLWMYPDYLIQKGDDSVDFLVLTQTPTLVQESATATDEPLPTETAIPLPKVTPTPQPSATTPPQPTPTSRPSTPICGGTALLILPVGLLAWKSRRDSSNH